MRWTGLAFWAAVGMAGCGGEDAETLTVDDYVPEAVRAQYEDLPEHVVTCVRFQYVSARRIVECSQDVAQVRFVEEQLNNQNYIASCENNAHVYTDEVLRRLVGCFSTWANGTCEDLEGQGGCYISQSWGPPGS